MPSTISARALWLACLLPVSAWSQGDPVTAELRQLKQELARLQDRIERLERQQAQATDSGASPEVVATRKAAPLTDATAAPLTDAPKPAKPNVKMAGRIHSDVYAFDEDQLPLSGGTELRRARLEWHADLGDWGADVVYELAGDGGADGLRDVLVRRQVGDTRWFLGQFKPLRSMAELTSSNNLVVPERPFLSASGVFSGRQHQQGLGFLTDHGRGGYGLTVFSLRDQATARNDGWGAAGRASFTGWNSPGKVLHLGAWYSLERGASDTPSLRARYEYAGRRGPRPTLASTTAGAAEAEVDAWAIEAAWQHGGWLLQSELGRAGFADEQGRSHLRSGYLQASYLFGGGYRAYKSAAGTFGGPKLERPAWELTARYDRVEGEPAVGDLSSTVIGLNYHYNDHLRWLLSYTLGDSDVDDDQTRQIALRTQFTF